MFAMADAFPGMKGWNSRAFRPFVSTGVDSTGCAVGLVDAVGAAAGAGGVWLAFPAGDGLP